MTAVTLSRSELVFVQDGLVAADDAALFVIGDAPADFRRRQAQHPRDVLVRFQRVGLQDS